MIAKTFLFLEEHQNADKKTITERMILLETEVAEIRASNEYLKSQLGATQHELQQLILMQQ